MKTNRMNKSPNQRDRVTTCSQQAAAMAAMAPTAMVATVAMVATAATEVMVAMVATAAITAIATVVTAACPADVSADLPTATGGGLGSVQVAGWIRVSERLHAINSVWWFHSCFKEDSNGYDIVNNRGTITNNNGYVNNYCLVVSNMFHFSQDLGWLTNLD